MVGQADLEQEMFGAEMVARLKSERATRSVTGMD
ncbi:hypothetical protein SAMN06297251_11113 [Fulvimarina manganoxydans]|uniref:Uncharacterized protein n=1 Tax=Fulvimarina manganoxydans TaxID=937218 RepID=A0A1W2CRX5_9HYPH|nr:hypothetical protein SAMN06297251_11113 [Fulvimarina manganoxydans]